MKALSLKKQFIFFSQLSRLYKAGVPLTSGLGHLQDQLSDAQLLKVVAVLQEYVVHQSRPLTEALRALDGLFPPLVMSLLEQGEQTGRLDTCLEQIVLILDRRRKRILEIQQTLAYPVFIAVVALLLGPIPAAYKGGVAVYFQQLAIPLGVLLALYLGITSFLGAVRTQPRLRYRFHKSLLGVPQIGKMLSKISLARFSRALSMMLNSGLPADRAIGVAARATENDYFVISIGEATETVREGRPMSEALARSPLFPRSYTGMLASGEATGEITAQLDSLADLYESEADAQITMVLNALGPMVLLLVVGMVAWQVVAEYMKYFDNFERLMRTL